jgi:sepiapterin reductase
MSKLIIVTGASRGLGEAIALQIAKSSLSKDSEMVLIARNKVQLDALAQKLCSISTPNNNFKVKCIAADLADKKNLPELVNEIFTGKSFTSVLLIQNAGSLGRLDVVANLEIENLRDAFELNIVSAFYLTSLILKKISEDIVLSIVNISSLAAVKAFECWSLYASGKAAREMFFNTILLERKNTRVLNYAPGPLDTDMQAVIRNDMPDGTLKTAFKNMKQEGTLVDPNESAKVLVILLEKDQYDNGAHLDYYDQHPFGCLKRE